jgi:hypothetical protein
MVSCDRLTSTPLTATREALHCHLTRHCGILAGAAKATTHQRLRYGVVHRYRYRPHKCRHATPPLVQPGLTPQRASRCDIECVLLHMQWLASLGEGALTSCRTRSRSGSHRAHTTKSLISLASMSSRLPCAPQVHGILLRQRAQDGRGCCVWGTKPPRAKPPMCNPRCNGLTVQWTDGANARRHLCDVVIHSRIHRQPDERPPRSGVSSVRPRGT